MGSGFKYQCGFIRRIKVIMSKLPLLLLLCGLISLVVTTNVNLSRRSKVITTEEIPCVAIELGKQCFIAKSTRPISVTIDIGVNVEKVSLMIKGSEWKLTLKVQTTYTVLKYASMSQHFESIRLNAKLTRSMTTSSVLEQAGPKPIKVISRACARLWERWGESRTTCFNSWRTPSIYEILQRNQMVGCGDQRRRCRWLWACHLSSLPVGE